VPRAPERLGRYLLFDVIAFEGPVGFSRAVAIKRLHPHLATEREFVAMFMDECKLAARIAHPNVVPVTDVVALPEELFLVMDYVPGESLARLLKSDRARPTPAIAVAVAIDILEGLHAAHEARSEDDRPLGIVHRDVSPQNVIVGTDGLARVLDFGIAWALERVQSTREGQLKGKLKYMAPEQLRGTGVDRKTDVYSVGVVLWEMLTGTTLFDGENEANTFSLVSLGAKHAPSSYAADVTPALDAAVMKALAVDPAKRTVSARQMATELARALPAANRQEIAEWVSGSAKQALGERELQVREVTNYTDVPDTMLATEPASVPRISVAPASLSSPKPAARAAVPALIGISGALLVGFVVMTIALVQRSRASDEPASAEPAEISVTSVESSPAPSVASPAIAPTPSTAPAPSSAPKKTTKALRADDCTPPYTIDHEGVRVPKRHCYK
jgi:serine/threonine protein kinase